MFEDQLEVKAENNQMAEAAKISEEETENTDNSEKKDSLGTDLESWFRWSEWKRNICSEGIAIHMKTNIEAKGVKSEKSIYWKNWKPYSGEVCEKFCVNWITEAFRLVFLSILS